TGIVGEGGHNGSVLVPTAATSQRRTADRDRRATAHFDSFQLVVGEEGYGATVGRPEREHCTLGACKGLRRSCIQRPQIELSAPGAVARKEDVTAVRRNLRRAAVVARQVELHLVGRVDLYPQYWHVLVVRKIGQHQRRTSNNP